MPARELERTASFENQLRALARRYPDLAARVNRRLAECSKRGAPRTSDRLRNVDGLPVFKERLGLGNVGKRRGVRIVYYCDEARVVALFVYAKSRRGDVPSNEIRTALAGADLL